MASEGRRDERNLEKIERLTRELAILEDKMMDCQENHAVLQEKRRELSERRRALRVQRREADAAGRAGLDVTLEELEEDLELIEERLEEKAEEIEALEESIDDIEEQLEALREEYEQRRRRGAHVVIGGKDIGQEIDKAMRKLTEIDVEGWGERLESAVEKMADQIDKGVGQFVDRVEKSFEKSEKPYEKDNRSYAGSTEIAGGDYGRLKFSGSGKITGDITCLALKTSGSLQAEGDIHSSGEVRSSGSMRCKGNLAGEEIKASGSIQVGGNLEGNHVDVSGSLKVGGGVKVQTAKISGSFSTGQDCEADRFRSSGKLNIEGLLSADEIIIHLGHPSTSQVGNIGGETITVTRSGFVGALQDIGLKGLGSRLITDTIEGDVVRLENVKAKMVRGRDVVIGNGCEIDCVEYMGQCEVSENAAVKETRQG